MFGGVYGDIIILEYGIITRKGCRIWCTWSSKTTSSCKCRWAL